eukprot:g3227.t1
MDLSRKKKIQMRSSKEEEDAAPRRRVSAAKMYYKVNLNNEQSFRVHKRYQQLKIIGAGSYGVVCSAFDTFRKRKVAIKKVANVFSNLVDAKRIVREIEVNKYLSYHENIVTIVDVMTDPPGSDCFKDLYIVTDLFECDLSRVVSSNQKLTNEHCQYFMYQLLCGLQFINSANILHRDLKPSNLLVNSDCQLVICDFGLSRLKAKRGDLMTEYVVTRYYRAPELLCENRTYDEKVDVWSAGLIFAEMLTGRVLLQGKSTREQLQLIIKLCGAPEVEDLSHVEVPGAVRIIQKLSSQYPKGLDFEVLFKKYTTNSLATLRDLKRAIRGEMLMSATLDQVRFSLTTNIVPAIWTKNAYPSNKPLSSWVKDLYKKLDFISTWLKSGQPKIFWMAGFFFPQGFMTGALQTHSRKYRIPIDRLNYGFKVLDAYEDSDDLSAPDDGIFISGLYMDGARWDVDAHLIRDSHPGELLSLCPVIHFIPEVNHKLKDGLYECPVYKTSTRAGQLSTTGMSTNFVLAVEFPIDTDQSTWILRGAACLTQTDS